MGEKKDCGCKANILGIYGVANAPGCTLGVTMDGPVVIDTSCESPLHSSICNVADIVGPIVKALNSQVDYEYITTPMLCIDGTWQYSVDVYGNGQLVAQTPVDTGIACDEPMPIQPQIQKIPYCDVNGTKTTHIKTCLFTFPDPADPTNVVETLLSDSDTGEKCAEDKVEVDFEVACNEDTDTRHYYTVVTTNGVPADPVVVDSGVPCDEDKPDFEQVQYCNLDTKTTHLLTSAIVDGVISTVSDSDLLINCVPSVVTVDVEYLCNSDTNVRDAYITTTTDGVSGDPVIKPSNTSCDEDKPDFEQIISCNLGTKTEHIITTSFDVDGNGVVISDVDTLQECKDTIFKEVCVIEGENGINGRRRDSEGNAAPFGKNTVNFPKWNTHINGDADEEVIITNNWNITDSDFPLTGAYDPNSDRDISSQELYWAYLNITEDMILRDTNGNTGEFISIYLQDCNKDMVQIVKDNYTTSGSASLGEFAEVCKGIQKIAIQITDYSVFGGFNLQFSTDGGATWANFPMSETYSKMPTKTIKCISSCSGADPVNVDGSPFTGKIVDCNPVCYPLTRKKLPDVEVSIVDGCEDVDGDPANFVPTTREVIFQDGVKQPATYYSDFANGVLATNQSPNFVDCSTGEPIDEPILPVLCDDRGIVDVYMAEGKNGVNVERWNTNAITGEPVSTVPSDIFVGPIDYSGMPAHDNGAPDGAILVETDLTVLDQVNDQSQFRYWTYLYITQSMRVRESLTRAEAVDYYLGECGEEPVKVATGVYPNTSNIAFDVSLEPGIHYIGGEVFDFSAYSGVNYQYSLDNGVTWSRIPASWLYSEKPIIKKCPAKVCLTNNVLADFDDMPLPATASLCEPSLCSGAAIQDPLQCSYETFYRLTNINNGINVSYRGDNGAPHDKVSNIFNGFYSHINGAPDGFGVEPNWVFNTTDAANTTGSNEKSTDQIIAYSYIELEQDALLREVNANSGEKGSVWIGECCGDPKMIYEVTDDTTADVRGLFGDNSSNPAIFLPAGLHWIGFQLSDLSATGGIQLQYSTDGGQTYSNVPESITYANKPTVEVVKGWVCDDGRYYTLDKSAILDPNEYTCKDPRCVETGGSNENQSYEWRQVCAKQELSNGETVIAGVYIQFNSSTGEDTGVVKLSDGTVTDISKIGITDDSECCTCK